MKPLAEVNRELQVVVGPMEPHDCLPQHPNWLPRLQDLLEDADVSLDAFCMCSRIDNKDLSWATFVNSRNRLHVATFSQKNRASAESLFALIQMTLQYQEKLLEEWRKNAIQA